MPADDDPGSSKETPKDTGTFLVSAKRNGTVMVSKVCATTEEARLTKDEYHAAGYQVLIEMIDGPTTLVVIPRHLRTPSRRLQT